MLILYVGKYGVETDANGLYYMRARYYNPQIQRFINVDPVRDGENWYNYCNNNVICSIDAKGLDAIIITAPDGAFGFGHTSALFEQDGKWLYFYWGGERTILVDSGLTKEDVNKYKLNSVAVSYALLNNDNIKYDERYTYFVYIEGDFSGSINYYKKIEDKTKNGKNEKYSLLDRNCLQVTNELIGYGV